MAPAVDRRLLLAFRIILFSLLGLAVLEMNSFGIADRSDQASQDAFYRVIAPLYPPLARDDIVVVLINDRAIQRLHDPRIGVFQANEWPLRYRDYGALLSRIAGYRPRAVFADVYLKRERSVDDSLESMVRRLVRAQERLGTRVFFAGGYADEDRTPLQRRLAERFSLSVNGWQGYGAAYPLKDGGRDTAAFDLYRIACLEGEPLAGCAEPRIDPSRVAERRAVSVRWGSRPAEPLFPKYTKEVCETEPPGVAGMVGRLFEGFLTGLFGRDLQRSLIACPYHRVIFADELVEAAKLGGDDGRRRLTEALEGKIVLVGVDLSGLNDFVDSPVHGRLPGVMFHAMALDNLMSFGANFTRAADEWLELLNLLAWVGMVMALSLALYFMERPVAGEERERHPGRVVVFSIGGGIVVALSLSLFFLLDYEPVNSLGFLALTGAVSLMVHGDVVEQLIVKWRKVRDGARRLAGRARRWFR